MRPLPFKMHTYRDYSHGASCFSMCHRVHSMASGSPKLPKEILDFDQDLCLLLQDLNPKNAESPKTAENPKDAEEKMLKLSWLSRLLALAMKKHIQAVDLIPSVDFPLVVHEENWMNEYMDQTARMLDACNALTGALSSMEQGYLLIRHACHVLLDAENASMEGEVQSSKNNVQELQFSDASVVVSEASLSRAYKSLQEWVCLQALVEQRSPKCSQLLKDMIKDLRPPRDRDLSKGKGFLHALYGANVVAVFAFYVMLLAVLREGELFSLTLPLPMAVPWSASVLHLVQAAKDEARESSSVNVCVGVMCALHASVKNLMVLIEQLRESKDGPVSDGERAALAGAVTNLCSQMDGIANCIESLCMALNDMLKAIVSSRSALLDKLGDFGAEEL